MAEPRHHPRPKRTFGGIYRDELSALDVYIDDVDRAMVGGVHGTPTDNPIGYGVDFFLDHAGLAGDLFDHEHRQGVAEEAYDAMRDVIVDMHAARAHRMLPVLAAIAEFRPEPPAVPLGPTGVVDVMAMLERSLVDARAARDAREQERARTLMSGLVTDPQKLAAAEIIADRECDPDKFRPTCPMRASGFGIDADLRCEVHGKACIEDESGV